MFAGPNGSGKSVLKSYLPEPLLGVYLNPDEIEAEVKELVMTAYRRAKDLVVQNRAVLDKVAEVLLDKENIDGDEFERIFLEARAPLYLKADSPGTTVPFTVR